MKKLITPILQSAVCFAADSAERKISGSFFSGGHRQRFSRHSDHRRYSAELFSCLVAGNLRHRVPRSADFAFLEINENTETYLFNGQAISREQLPTYLNHIGKNNKETQLIIFCADNVKHADLVKALDLCRLSSLSNISIHGKITANVPYHGKSLLSLSLEQ